MALGASEPPASASFAASGDVAFWQRRGVRAGAYGALLAGAVGLTALAMYLGSSRSAAGSLPVLVKPAGSQAARAAVPVWHLAAAIGVVALLCRLGGWLARRFGQPA